MQLTRQHDIGGCHVGTGNVCLYLCHRTLSVPGQTPRVANPIRMSQTLVSYRQPPPTLGEHTQDVLAGVLRLTASRMEQLNRQGITS